MKAAATRTQTTSIRQDAVNALKPLKTTCASCNMRELCAPCCGLDTSGREAANRIAYQRIQVPRGACLFRTGERFVSLFAVRKGFFKFSVVLEDGRRDQVTGFALRGEIMGVDGIATSAHTCDAVALEDSVVCAIPYAGLQLLAHELPSVQRALHNTMSRVIVREHAVMLQLGSMQAEERLAVFLVHLSQRFAAQGDAPLEFNMRMTRDEIGSYLGMTLETVSRTLSRFQQQGLISMRQKRVRIRDLAALEHVLKSAA